MKKSLKILSLILSLGLVGSTVAGLVACKDNDDGSKTPGEFSYETEMLSKAEDVSSGYNSNLFYVNTLDFEIADPTVIYVTEGDQAGYFYAYGTSDEIGCHGFQAWRSKDLSHWECMGVAYQPDYEVTWAFANYWAPEIIYDDEMDLYYLFYNAFNYNDKVGADDRLCMSVAYSRDPQGPFVSPNNREDLDGNELSSDKPVFDFTINNPVLAEFAKNDPKFIRDHAIDASPFIDPETGDKYMYFSYYNTYSEGSFIYGVKMKDWFTPDYTTLTMLTYPGYLTVAGGVNKVKAQEVSEGNVNEGPFMIYHEGKYYMTLSIYGYQDPNYQVIQAIGDSPLGDFEKMEEADGGKVVSTLSTWNHITSAGHHCFIQCGDELLIAYHTFRNRIGIAGGRALAVDKVIWTENADGVPVMHTNGPTWSVQPLPESVSGYKNIAPSATVTADKTAAESDVSLLTDELIKYQEFDLVAEYAATEGTSTIKLSWDTFKTVRGIMIYNSYNYDNTFVSVDKVEFEYQTKDGSTAKVAINDLEFDWDWNCEDYIRMRPGGSAIAEFAEMPVKSVTITIRSASGAEFLSLSEIVVLGKDTACAGVDRFEEYSYTNAEYGSPHIEKDSLTFGDVAGTQLETWWGYDLTNDDGTDDAYILQTGCTDQYAYFKDVYSTTFYAEAEFTVTSSVPFAKDPFPKFGFAMSTSGDYANTIFYYVDAVNYTNTVVGCAQRRLDNVDWDWEATEQLVSIPGISYANENYVKLAVLRKGAEFYFVCNDMLVLYYDNFNIFTDSRASGVGFLSFNTPMKIKNYSATTDEAVIAEMSAKYAYTDSGENFGTVGGFSATTGWDLTSDNGENATATQKLPGEQYAYFKDVNSTQFYVETEITVTKDLGDLYPKFGLVLQNDKNTLFFYVDAADNFTAQRVGYLFLTENGDWPWENPDYNRTETIGLGDYTGGSTVKLGILRDGNTIKLYVDDRLVFTLTDVYGFGEEDASVAGVFSFTVGVVVSNYSATTDISGVEE